MRAPLWVIVLLILAIIGIGVYGYFTTPLPFGLNAYIPTPGGGNAGAPSATTGNAPAGVRTAAGQPLVLGATSVMVQSVQRNQDLASGGRAGPAGSFTVVDLEVQNGGSQPLTPEMKDFRLVDDRGRVYAVDPEATRSVNASNKKRVIFDATVPPAGRVDTLLAFETPADANALTLRVSLGYGEVELPR
jgi:Domain of unknown function (DUF4352)